MAIMVENIPEVQYMSRLVFYLKRLDLVSWRALPFNSACRSFAFGSPKFHSAKKDQNCLLVEDGSIKATKKIGPGTELLTGYSPDEHDIKQTTKFDEEKKGSSRKRKKAAGSSN
jgi:hypothetical protein